MSQRVSLTYADSEPWWAPTKYPSQSPNVVVILFDDTGFAHFGCYGSTIETPNIDRLAQRGLRFTNFHTTALCSPTRAALLTGRNHHAVGMRALANFDTGFPNMRGYVTRHAATLAELLRAEGYRTFAAGKWHLAPMEDASAAGPFDNWPLQRGFDRYYGFLNGATDHFFPELTEDNHHIDPLATPEQGYHLTEDLVDHSIRFIKDSKSVRPGTPFFLYLALGATHSPHQAPDDYLLKYRGRFDEGWDVIRERWYRRQLQLGVIPADTELALSNPGVEPWDALTPNAKRFALRLQEAFAAFLDHTDAQLGRLFEYLETVREMDNTLIFLLSDNGASAGGGATGITNGPGFFGFTPVDVDAMQSRLENIGRPNGGFNDIPWGWAQAGNTPLRWYKQNTHGGGVRDPLIVYCPGRIKDPGGVRQQFHHVSDIVPTILELVEAAPPAQLNGVDQMPITGTSLAYAIDTPEAPTRKAIQYFEMMGHRGIWADGWKAVTRHIKGMPYEEDRWELYHLDKDFSETTDLAETHPEKLRALIALWWLEAGRNGVLPLDDRSSELFLAIPRPGSVHHTGVYKLQHPISHLPADVVPPIWSESWTLTAHISPSADGSLEGVIFSEGTIERGLSLYVLGNELHFSYKAFENSFELTSPLGAGPITTVGVEFVRRDIAEVTLKVNGTEVASGINQHVVTMMSWGGAEIGRSVPSPVTGRYSPPFEFSGTIYLVEIRTGGAVPDRRNETSEHRFESEMARQ